MKKPIRLWFVAALFSMAIFLSAGKKHDPALFATNHTINLPSANFPILFSESPGNVPPPVGSTLGLVLINADTDQDIGMLSDGDTINLSALGTNNLNVRADVLSGSVGSVKFGLDATSNFRTESAAPYALVGDNNGDYYDWTPSLGNHTLTATGYSKNNAGGTAGTPKVISFTVIDNSSVDCNGDVNGSAFYDACGVCVGGNTGNTANADKDACGVCFGDNSSCADCNGDINGSADFDDCGICSGGNTGLLANADKDTCGVCFGDNTSCQNTGGSCQHLEVVSFTLMHDGNGGEIGPLTDGYIINKNAFSGFSIRADVCDGPVGSVDFRLNGNLFSSENAAPYALNGDSNGNYNQWNPNTGSYTLTSTPYSNSNRNGTAGIAYSISFTVVDQTLPPDCNGDAGGSATVDDCGVCAGGNTGKQPNGDKDFCGVCFGDNSTCASPCDSGSVVSYDLVHPGIDGDIGPLNDGDNIDKSVTGNFSIRANVCPDSVSRVEFKLNGNLVFIDSLTPFAINGDYPQGEYTTWHGTPGFYTLEATPYVGPFGSETMGIPSTINFSVTDTATNPYDSICGAYPGGRILLTFDGNLHDSDDYAALPMAMAMIRAAGLNNSVVHIEHSNHIGLNSSQQQQEMIYSAQEAAQRFDFPTSIIYNVHQDPDSASDAFANAVNASSLSNPLWVLAGGPMESIWRGINKAQPAKRQFVRIISHSGWNENHTESPLLINDWDDLKADFQGDGTVFIQIHDQNNSNGGGDFQSIKSLWKWLLDPNEPDWNWLYSRVKSNGFDVSDAGMTYWLVSGGPNGGNMQAGWVETKSLFEKPCPFDSSQCFDNTAPTVNFSSPADSTSFIAGSTVLLEVAASDTDGNVSFIRFFDDNQLLGTDSTAPYQFSYGSIPAGTYHFVASATDACDSSGFSDTLYVFVTDTATNDCNGDPNGAAFIDDCGVCAGGNTGKVANADKDACGVCFGDNSTCTDCHGDPGGTAFTDSCGVCVGGNTGKVANADQDACGVCFGDNSTCTDCNGDPGGTAFTDSCGVCVGGNTGKVANADQDACGVCFGDNSTCTDCNGDPNGTAVIDDCGICAGGNTGNVANADKDDCGICFGNNADKDCNGDCFGTATIDECGTCSGGNTGLATNADKDTCGVCFGDNTSCAPACVTLQVVSFTLMHEGNGGEIATLTDGFVINENSYNGFSIRADVCDNPVGSVEFVLNGNSIQKENVMPYSIAGDGGGKYKAWNPGVGSYTLTGIPYSGNNGNGTQGITYTVNFTIISNSGGSVDCNGDPNGSASIDDCGVCAGGNTGKTPNADKDDCGVCNGNNADKDCNGDCFGTASIDDCGVCSGGNTGRAANKDMDACGLCFGDGSSCAGCDHLEVTALVLVNAGSGNTIDTLNNGDVLDKNALGAFSIKATVCDDPVGSVKFVLNGSNYQVENVIPYALNGNPSPTNYNPWSPANGSYVLTATPYSNGNANGTAGIALTRTFQVGTGSAKSQWTENTANNIEIGDLEIYPVPARDEVVFSYPVSLSGRTVVRVINQLGQTVLQREKYYTGATSEDRISSLDLPAGLYLVEVTGMTHSFNAKIIIER